MRKTSKLFLFLALSLLPMILCTFFAAGLLGFPAIKNENIFYAVIISGFVATLLCTLFVLWKFLTAPTPSVKNLDPDQDLSARPKDIQIQTHGQNTKITIPWQRRIGLYFFFIWAYSIYYIFWQGFHPYIALFLVPSSYLLIATLMNQSDIKISDSTLFVSQVPIPFSRIQIPLTKIQHVYYSKAGLGTFGIFLVTSEKKYFRLLGFYGRTSENTARYVASYIQKLLNLAPYKDDPTGKA